MIPPRSDTHKWVRKTDGDMHVVAEQPQTRWYPGTLDELLWIVTKRFEEAPPVNVQSHVCGSHWAMSKTAVTPGQMIETSTPVHEEDGDQAAPRLNHVLYDVIPKCMTQAAKSAFLRQDVQIFNPLVAPDFWPTPMKFYLFHVESGMRIYELYSFSDSGVDGTDDRSLAKWVENNRGTSPVDYTGPWALETMGGAGGQTIAGVASTATHGGDVKASSISDLVVALHVIAPDGQEYWIEKTKILPTQEMFPLVDEDLLNTVAYPANALRRTKIKVIRSDDLMQAVIVSCGRMGIIYSMVLRTVRQYALNEKIDSSLFWDDVKTWLANPADPKTVALMGNRFARIDVDVYPKPVFDWETVAWMFGAGLLGGIPLALVATYAGISGKQYRCWIYTRTAEPLDKSNLGTVTAPEYFGRKERAGGNQGAAAELENQQDPPGNFRDPCSSANWLRQFLQDTNNLLEDIRNDALIAAGLLEIAADAAAFFGNVALAAFLRNKQSIALATAFFAEVWILTFSAIVETLPDTMLFGDFIAAIINTFSAMHAGSIIQLMYWAGSNSQHTALKHPGISYAVMDRHSYMNKGCVAPGDSFEFFMDATTPDLVSFIDYVLDQVRDLAGDGEGFGGYISMRFMTSCPSFLAMQRWPSTCSIEIAGLSRVGGTSLLFDRLDDESRKRNIIVHWGQRNTRSQADIEKLYSPALGGPLFKWRKALSDLSANGRLANFSTAFTKYKGLEITTPKLYDLHATMSEGCHSETTTVHYDAFDNPPETRIWLTQRFENGAVNDLLPGATASKGDVAVAFGHGRSQVRLHALRELNDNKYESPILLIDLHGFATGDEWHFQFVAHNQMIAGVSRWVAEVNLFSQYISNTMRISSVKVVASVPAAWIVRNAEVGVDVAVDPVTQVATLLPHPVMNKNWLFFTKLAATGAPPQVDLYFRMEC